MGVSRLELVELIEGEVSKLSARARSMGAPRTARRDGGPRGGHAGYTSAAEPRAGGGKQVDGGTAVAGARRPRTAHGAAGRTPQLRLRGEAWPAGRAGPRRGGARSGRHQGPSYGATDRSRWDPRAGGGTAQRTGVGALFTQRAWKGNSTNFAITEFCEIRSDRFLGRMHILAHSSPPTRAYPPRSLLSGQPLRGRPREGWRR